MNKINLLDEPKLLQKSTNYSILAVNHDKENNKISIEALSHFWKMLFPADFTDKIPKPGVIVLQYGYDHLNP